MNKKYVQRLFVAALLIFTIISSGVPASAEEATLRMLVWEGYTPEEQKAPFIKMIKDKYDVDLKIQDTFVAASDDFFPALRDGTVDIISPSNNVLKDKRWKLIKLKLLLPINLDNVPNYTNLLPSLQKADYCTEGGEVYSVPHVRGPYGLAYNTAKVTEEPTSWNVLWDPKYKGQYTLGKDAYQDNVSFAALAAGVGPDDIYNFSVVNTPEIQAKLESLAANAAPMWVGVDDPKTLKGLSLAVVWGFSLPALKEMGETWKIAEPKEGTTGWVDGFAISNTLADKPKLKRIAEEWLNWILRDEYQVYDIRGLACAPVTTSVKAKLTPEEIAQFHLDDPTHFEKNRILWRPLEKKDRKGLQKLWTDALKKANLN